MYLYFPPKDHAPLCLKMENIANKQIKCKVDTKIINCYKHMDNTSNIDSLVANS